MKSPFDDDEPPDAALDALRTELNSARAEAEGWFFKFKAELDRAEALKASLYDAERDLDAWVEAERELWQRYLRLEVKLHHEQWTVGFLRDLVRFTEALVPEWLRSP